MAFRIETGIGNPTSEICPTQVTMCVASQALPFSAAMVALSVIPFEKIPQLRSLAEVTRASKVITLYAFGRRFAPLRALPAALIIATSAAVCEELAFRGTLQARTSATRRACSARARPR